MKRTTRRAGAAAAALCGSLLVTACNAHPGQAAFVGDSGISTSTLQGLVSRSLQNSECGKAYAGHPITLERIKLGDLIQQKLLEKVADRLGVEVTQADVDAELSTRSDVYGGRRLIALQASQNGAVAPQDLATSVRTDVLQTKIEDALTAKVQVPDSRLRGFYQQHVDHYLEGHIRDMVVTDKATADSVVQQLKANPDEFGDVLRQQAAKQQAAGQHGDPNAAKVLGPFIGLNPKSVVDAGGLIGKVPLAQLGSAGYPTDPGSVFALQLSNGWNVVEILDRSSFDDVKQQVRRDVLAQQRDQALQRTLAQQAKQDPVHVNPRYGRWDPRQERVVAGTQDAVAYKTQPATDLACGQASGSQG